MKGASAEPLAKIRMPPSKSRNSTIGASQYFLRTRRKLQNSRTIASLLMVFLPIRQSRIVRTQGLEVKPEDAASPLDPRQTCQTDQAIDRRLYFFLAARAF